MKGASERQLEIRSHRADIIGWEVISTNGVISIDVRIELAMSSVGKTSKPRESRLFIGNSKVCSDGDQVTGEVWVCLVEIIIQ